MGMEVKATEVNRSTGMGTGTRTDKEVFMLPDCGYSPPFHRGMQHVIITPSLLVKFYRMSSSFPFNSHLCRIVEE
jgi:hypothetical protein